MANVSYLRPGADEERSARRQHERLTAQNRSNRPGRYALVLAAVVVALVAAGAIAVVSSSASISADGQALAHVNMPLGGGTIKSVVVTRATDNAPIAVTVRGDQIWPSKLVRAGRTFTVTVIIKRPGLVSWLTGSTERIHLTLTTPSATLRSQYLTLRSDEPLRVGFDKAVQMVAYGQPGAVHRHVLSSARSILNLPRSSAAGSELIAATPRTWETAPPKSVSWFPAGTQQASAVANPAPGTQIGTSTPITLTFSQPVNKALGGHMPPVQPNTPGTWQQVNDHTIMFQPQGYGYGLGATVTVPLPGGVQLVGAKQSGVGTWSVPGGSTSRLQQLLSLLGYLPLNFHYANGTGVALTPQAQEAAAVHPPAGTFTWKYGNTPSALKSFWQPGAYGTMTKGAIMSFENDQGMTADGVAGAAVWKALLAAVISGKRASFGYTFVYVDQGNESLNLWHNGQTVLTTPVNTGVAGAPTANGLFTVFEHLPVTTMSGTNPDGSHYSDPGIPWVSYFNGGDALHGFVRASYGTPQSDGCVEMPIPTAARVYPYTPIGTLVDVV